MKNHIYTLTAVALLAACLSLLSCKSVSSGSIERNGHTTVIPEITSENMFSMNIDSVPVSYTIDISTPEGRLKLNKITLEEANQLALVECLIKNNCANLFNPQYTHLKKGKDILRVTVFGFPARYKRIDTEHETQSLKVEESVKLNDSTKVSRQKTITRKHSINPKAPANRRR